MAPGAYTGHPPSASIGQDAILALVNPWLGTALRVGPERDAAVAAMAAVVDPPRPGGQAELLRQRAAEAETKLRRLTDALGAGIDPVALAGPINAAQAEADAARAELDVLATPPVVPAREQVEKELDLLGDRLDAVLGPDRSPQLLRELYGSLDLRLTWHHADRRLVAEIDLGALVARDEYDASPTNRGVKQCVRGGT